MRFLRFFCLIGAALLAPVLLAAAPRPLWENASPGPGGAYRISGVSASGFQLRLERNAVDGKACVLVCHTLDKLYHGQSRLSFTVAVAGSNPVTLQPLLSVVEDGKSKIRFGRKILLRGGETRQFVFPLDVEFHCADAMYHLGQIKLSFDISGAAPGTAVDLTVSHVALGSAADMPNDTGRAEVVVYPPKSVEPAPAPNALAVYFMLDNEDDQTVFGGRGSVPPMIDRVPYRGFRAYLLSRAGRACRLAATPEEADAIVYSSCGANPALAERVARCVGRGTPLFAAGPVADPEIAALLPVKLEALPRTAIPERRKLIPAPGTEALFAGLNPARFGVYVRAIPASDAQTLLSYEGAGAAMVRRGHVIYAATTLGAEVIPRKNHPDALLFRALGLLTGKKVAESARPVEKPDRDGFYAGSGSENFGRFGVELGDGLTVEAINNRLEVRNGAAEYAFSSENQPKITLNDWLFREQGAPEGAAQRVDSRYRWHKNGTFELTADCAVPQEWQGRDLSFVVEKGIDDTAEVFFNDTLIGKVGVETRDYWMTPHRHAIPAKLVRPGALNRVRVVTQNLRGEGYFGSCPEIIQPRRAVPPVRFVPDRCNQLGKGGVLTEASGASRRFDTSLAFPGIRWEIASDSVDLTLVNTGVFAAYPAPGGVEIADLRKIDRIPTDGTQPWLLLFPAGNGRPLLLVFSRRQGGIEVMKTAGQVGGLRFQRKDGVGMVLPLWITGCRDVDCSGWAADGLPVFIQKAIAFWYPKSFCYPAAMNERFRIDESKGRVVIRSRFSYIRTPNDWNVSAAPFAPVPPLAYFTKGRLFDAAAVENWQMVTNFGFFAAAPDTDTAEWSLPLPPSGVPLVPAMTERTAEWRVANEVFRAANRWSAGGHTTRDSWTPQYPTGVRHASRPNVNWHGWLMGLNQILAAPFGLDDASRAEFTARLRRRFFEPLEFFRYKAAYRWREEPMSGIRYPIYFNSRHANATHYAPGTGTTINYGDANETGHVLISMLYFLADRYGQADLVRANPGFLYEASRFPMVSDDWGYLACHCRESGQSATIDMLNAELGTMTRLARLAEITGDEPLRMQALYRAARRQVASAARLDFADFAVRHGLIGYPGSVATGVGFTEEGLHFRTKGFEPASIDLFDMSQGLPPELAAVMIAYAPDRIRDYFNASVNPWFAKSFQKRYSHWSFALLATSAMYGTMTNEMVAAHLARFFGNRANLAMFGEDWPGMTVIPDLAQILYRLDGAVRVRTVRDMEILKLDYAASQKRLTIAYRAGESPRLELESRLDPADPAWKRGADGGIVIPVKPGEQKTLELKFK